MNDIEDNVMTSLRNGKMKISFFTSRATIKSLKARDGQKIYIGTNLMYNMEFMV